MPSADLQWIEIKDFSPGIFDTVTPNNPIGAATRSNTYKCIATENGALAPAPRRTLEVSDTDRNGAGEPASPYFIGGLFCADPTFDGTNPLGPDQNNTEIFVGYEWFESNDDRRRQVRRYKRGIATPAWETVFDDTLNVPNLFDIDYRPARCVFQSSRSNQSTPTDVGVPIVVFCYDGILESFPDDTAPGVTGTFSLPQAGPGFPEVSLIISHQNRIVVFPLTLTGFGLNDVYATNEGLYFTATNDVSVNAAVDFSNVVFGSENPTGYQCGASLTANELLLLKSKGGAIMLRGDLLNVTSINLPNVQSPGFSLNHGCRTKLGFAYCVDNMGMFVWAGGDASEDISLQLAPNFWRPTAQQSGNYHRAHTTCAKWAPWIVTPNNWLYDMDKGGWWRLDGGDTGVPIQMYHMDVDWTGRWLYGSNHAWEDGTSDLNINPDKVVFYEYDKLLGAATYSWQSHPIQGTMDRVVNVREVVLVLSGEGDVTVTVTGRDGAQDTAEFSVNDLFPVTLRAPVAVQGNNIQIRIEASVPVPASPNEAGAPTVHAVRLGIKERMRTDQVG